MTAPGMPPMPTAPPPASDPFSAYGQPPPAGGPPPNQAPPAQMMAPAPPVGNPFGIAPPTPSMGDSQGGDFGGSQGGDFAGPPAPMQMPNAQPTPTGGAAYADPWGSPAPPTQPPAPLTEAPPAQPQYGAPPPQYGAPPPQQPPPQYGAPPEQGPPQPPSDASMGAIVPALQQSNPYAQPGYGQPPPPPGQYGQLPPPPGQYGQPPPPPGQYGQPPPPPGQYGQPPPPPGQYGQPPPPGRYGQPPPPGQYGQLPPPGQYGVNPYGQQQQPMYQQQQPPPPVPVDPFSVFESQSNAAPESTAMVPVAPNAAAAVAPTAGDDAFWGSFGADASSSEIVTVAGGGGGGDSVADNGISPQEEKNGEEGLPPGGEWYDARIFTPTLGVMFFKPQELTDSLFLNTDKGMVDGLGDRPVVAFIVEGSSARSAGVELGHVLLKVNGVDVGNPKEASRLIKEGPRPLPLLFYVPNTDVVVAEGEHMVKYDTRETTAPNSAKEWKPKYVVIGGIIAQPWMMNMYRSKVSYLFCIELALVCHFWLKAKAPTRFVFPFSVRV